MKREGIVVFVDSECGICTAAGNRIKRLDRRNIFTVKGLDSLELHLKDPNKAKELLAIDSLVVLEGDRFITHSDAVIFVLSRLGRLHFILGKIASWIPLSIRDSIYKSIAKRRKISKFSKSKTTNACQVQRGHDTTSY